MDRRNFLKWTGATALTGFLGLNWSPKSASAGLTTLAYQGDSIYAGWLNDPRIREQFIQNTKNPYLSQVNADIKGTGKGQTAFLWKFLEQVTGRPLLPHDQQIGDCFIADTLVTMANGLQKPIQDVSVGEYVISHLGYQRRVNRIIKKPYSGKLITTSCIGYASDITSTPDHRFLTQNLNWTSIQDLDTALVVPTEGKHIQTTTIRRNKIDCGLVFKIKTKQVTEVTDISVYCLEVDHDQSFIANGYAVHNCVSHGYGLGVDILTATQILKRNSPQRWIAKAATEIIYAGGRIEIAKKEYGKNWRGDGMTGTVAAEFVKRYGILLRQKYLDKWDFTLYTGQRARTLGNQGVPDELEPLCKVHPVGCVTLVQSWEEARDCIYNGYPVPLCSNQGFNTRGGRDKDGFLSPSRQPWNHCMLLAGMDDNPVRPGGLIINSWGSQWIDGPKRYEQPDGSFWADASVIDRICKQQDTVALSCYAGYPRQQLVLW